jgi:hypothetical protein
MVQVNAMASPTEYNFTFNSNHQLSEIEWISDTPMAGRKVTNLTRNAAGLYELRRYPEGDGVDDMRKVVRTLSETEALVLVRRQFSHDQQANTLGEVIALQTVEERTSATPGGGQSIQREVYTFADDELGFAVEKFDMFLRGLTSHAEGKGIEQLSPVGQKLATQFKRFSKDGIDGTEFQSLLDTLGGSLTLEMLLPYTEKTSHFDMTLTESTDHGLVTIRVTPENGDTLKKESKTPPR